MIISEAEARDRLAKSPLRHFDARFFGTLAQTTPGPELVPRSDERNLEQMLQASLGKIDGNE